MYNLSNCLYTASLFFLNLYMPGHLLWVLGVSASVVELPYTASFFPAAEEETDSTYDHGQFLLLFSFSFLFEMSPAMPGISLIPLFHFQIQNTNKPSSVCKCQKKDFNEPNIIYMTQKNGCVGMCWASWPHGYHLRLQAIPCVPTYQHNMVT